jgi:hypothetical protein
VESWQKNVINGERGPLAVWYSCGHAEIAPAYMGNVCGAPAIAYELVVAGESRGLYDSLKKAKTAFTKTP